MFTKVGPVFQIGYVVRDIDEAIAHWNAMGVGPFFLTRRPAYVEQSYKGQHTDCEISAAFAYSGDLQIELVQQKNTAPSAFQDFIEAYGYGAQHLGILSDDILRDTQALTANGFKPFHRMLSAIGVETIFFDSELHGGTVLELISAVPLVTSGFAQMKAAAQSWDGSGPSIIEF
ncbi:Glyoxalase/Bleomycin resistance protein/Dioxygenase superfamily protein [Ralstonia sp. 25mfcol4.1]|uniref:VOC family protein n=1 Tax=Ralstonia sp. 25mfcol4.1 TaxID=1761899 RepID=UPI0004257066|nr:VOC family protein [Ralstonia sp. 25mfcol4.1]SDP77568.1 Glyoxalase/Bleomycin resistance protein/Dioxygenase superfamily protein [Ralstonia sp. 25mfcol4.1]